jgi:hypothetical protein
MSTYFMTKLVVYSSLVFVGMAYADGAETKTPSNSRQVNVSEEDLQKTAAAGEAWLSLVDKGEYESSWTAGALTFQLTISKKEWSTSLAAQRKSLGNVVSRTLVEQRVAENPRKLPAGEYMVNVYKTSFSNRPEAVEVMTLQKQNNGSWKVLTYFVN